MKGGWYSSRQVVRLLRKADRLLGERLEVAEVAKQIWVRWAPKA